ncbi:MAG: DJ-1/PfpI family protein [Treponema sp.]|jgi:4-methyl-5(b-hydroxyethyl)-thiazole monophosphate biosynthesis|nr:DJ-1/PfpI family protein [Treponema sp.]
MLKKAVVLLAEGFEEVEAITPIDYLRRAGIAVTIAAIGNASGGVSVKGARGISVQADATLQELVQRGEAASWDAVVVPGGMPGASNLAASPETGALLAGMAAAGKWVCAICASPAVVLAPLGLLAGKQFTCYPGMETKAQSGVWSDERVVVDANASGGGIITSRGAGTAGEFAVAIIGQLLNEEAGTKIAQAVLL